MAGAVLDICDCSFEKVEHVSFEGEKWRAERGRER